MKKLFLIAVVAVSMFFCSCEEEIEAPIAKFSVQDGVLYETKQIQFTNTSKGDDASYLWTFEDAEVPASNIQNPTAQWMTSGFYNVTLKVSNNAGTDEFTMPVKIEDYVPEADFLIPEGVLYTTKEIQFTNTSGGVDVSYEWTFEGAVNPTSNQENPVATWDKPGRYSVTLKVSNEGGVDEFVTVIDIIEYIPFLKVKNNSLTAIGVVIGIEGLQNEESDLEWWLYNNDENKGFAQVQPGEIEEVKLWDEDDQAVDFNGYDKLYYAIFSWDFDRGCSVYTVDAEGGSSLLAWHSYSLNYVDMDASVEVDVSQDFFYVTMDNKGYSDLEGVYSYMGSDPNDQNVGYADVTIPYDTRKDVGYFDAYTTIRVASFINSSQYLYWTEGEQFEFTEGMRNFQVILTNDSYKSGELKANVISTAKNAMVALEGAIKLNAPRKVKMNNEAFEILNK